MKNRKREIDKNDQTSRVGVGNQNTPTAATSSGENRETERIGKSDQFEHDRQNDEIESDGKRRPQANR